MKIQPIDASILRDAVGGTRSEVTVKPVMKSRLKRLFRISAADKSLTAFAEEPPPLPTPHLSKAGSVEFEPSSVCLSKMVRNFIEDNNEKQAGGRNRCNCFNGNGIDSSSDGESENVSSTEACDFLKSLVVCACVNERTVLADTAKIVEKNKACKRKDELRKIITDGLVQTGYNASICKSKWDKTPYFPAGEYEYVDLIIEGDRLIIDIDFRSEFELARSTKAYRSILQCLPYIFVGKPGRLSKIITLVSEAAKLSLQKKGMHVPPWRRAEYVQAKWLSPQTRLILPSQLLLTNSVDLDELASDEAVIELKEELSQSSSPLSESVFAMSETSGGEEPAVKMKPNGSVIGLASLMEVEP
ncbi:hypothetical protein Ancab_020167 [Ancistrocladus abbreviatus]